MSTSDVNEGNDDKHDSNHFDTCNSTISCAEELFCPFPFASSLANLVRITKTDVSNTYSYETQEYSYKHWKKCVCYVKRVECTRLADEIQVFFVKCVHLFSKIKKPGCDFYLGRYSIRTFMPCVELWLIYRTWICL